MIYVVLVLLGVCLGSFANALVWRLRQQSIGKKQAKDPHLSILRGRSMCPSCKHTLAAKDLLPLISWLLLRGKCRYCHKPISVEYPLVELLTALLFVVSYLIWPLGFKVEGIFLFVSWLLLLTGLVALAVYDIKWMLLPNKILYPLIVFWAAVIVVQVGVFMAVPSLLLGAGLGVLACGGVFWLIFQLSRGTWIGGGDVKLGFLLGLLVGDPLKAFMLILLASLIGTLWALPLLLNKKLGMKAQLPFGPFLIIAGIIVFLLGERIVEIFSGYFLVV